MGNKGVACLCDQELQQLQTHLGYTYHNIDLLRAALLHPSCFRNEPSPLPFKIHFQRLEFLGDRFLSALLGAKLFELFPNAREGFLSKAYMILSQESALVELSERLSLKTYLQIDQPKFENSILADAVEALIGSLWLDSDYITASKHVILWFGDIRHWVSSKLNALNPKGQLQEFLGDHFHDIHYELVHTWGPEHKRQFRSAVYLKEQFLSEGEGSSKQTSEESAAVKALILLKEMHI